MSKGPPAIQKILTHAKIEINRVLRTCVLSPTEIALVGTEHVLSAKILEWVNHCLTKKGGLWALHTRYSLNQIFRRNSAIDYVEIQSNSIKQMCRD